MGPYNLISEVIAPNLEQEDFAQGLSEMARNINENFKKIVSAPIYRGQSGTNIKMKSVAILEDDNNTFTDTGVRVAQGLFPDIEEDFETITELENIIKTDYEKYQSLDNKNFITDYFAKNNKILMFYEDDLDEELICPAQMYMFQDMRVLSLEGLDDEQDFEDFSCFLSFDWIDDDYEFVRTDYFPTISWSENINEYVWKINGQETNITVKGIKGRDAKVEIPMFKSEITDATNYKAKFFYDNSKNSWTEITDDVDISAFSKNQTCINYLLTEESVTGVEFSKIDSISIKAPKYIYIAKQNVSIKSVPLNTMLDDIRPFKDNSISDTNPAGLYIPAKIQNDTKDYVHAFWRTRVQDTESLEEDRELNLGYVYKSENDFVKSGVTPTVLNLWNYSKINFDDKFVIENNTTTYRTITTTSFKVTSPSGGGYIDIYDSNFSTGESKSYIHLNAFNQIKLQTNVFGLYKNNDDGSVSSIIYYGSTNDDLNFYKNTIIKASTLSITTKQALSTKTVFSADNEKFKTSILSINLNDEYATANTINIGNTESSTIDIEGKEIKIDGYNYKYESYTNWTSKGTDKLVPTASSDATKKTKDYGIEYTYSRIGRLGFLRILSIPGFFKNNDTQEFISEKNQSKKWGDDEKYKINRVRTGYLQYELPLSEKSGGLIPFLNNSNNMSGEVILSYDEMKNNNRVLIKLGRDSSGKFLLTIYYINPYQYSYIYLDKGTYDMQNVDFKMTSYKNQDNSGVGNFTFILTK